MTKRILHSRTNKRSSMVKRRRWEAEAEWVWTPMNIYTCIQMYMYIYVNTSYIYIYRIRTSLAPVPETNATIHTYEYIILQRYDQYRTMTLVLIKPLLMTVHPDSLVAVQGLSQKPFSMAPNLDPNTYLL